MKGLKRAQMALRTGLALFLFFFGIYCVHAQGAVSLWNASATPNTVSDPDTGSVELGMKFQSDVAGTVTGVRFFKGSRNTGTHVGHLWSSGGALLATVTFTSETASGWQQANFPAPIAIQAKTTYVISYLAPKGHYADDGYFFNSGVNNAPLHGLPNGSSGPNGLYAYGSGSFPNQSWEASNYWVDLMFNPSGVPPSTYSISGKVSGAAATLTLSGVTSRTTKTDSSGNYSFSGLANGLYIVAASQSGYSFSPATVSKTVSGGNVTGVNFTGVAVPPGTYSLSGKVTGSAATLTLSGASSGTTKTDANGNYSFSGLANGTYLVAPSQTGYSFTPSTVSKSVSGGNVTGVNFTAAVKPLSHTVSLSWAASTSPNIAGYRVYRAGVSGGPYGLLTSSLISGTSYVDGSVASGQTYFYVTTAVSSGNMESGYSNQSVATIPTP